MLGPAAHQQITKGANDSAVKWLLQSGDPSIRYFTLTDILNKSKDSLEVEKTRRLIPGGPRVSVLVDGQESDGGFECTRTRNGLVLTGVSCRSSS
ncbi:MAG TPA: hypothetical protein VNA15_06075 [Candidatus Angelobacter sp.]|nr:hypothetical protein [Candidatus Angelobacter sp.]